MKKIFGIGVSGLVGSRMVELLKDSYEFDNLSIETGTNITDPSTLTSISDDTTHEAVILLAAKADVDACEIDKDLGKEGAAWKINVEGTRNVIEACQKQKKYLIYISTDFVFSGDDAPQGGYTEDSLPSPVNWYGKTKYEAEELVKKSDLTYSIVRLAYPYRTPFAAKKDFVQTFLSRLRDHLPLAGVTDHTMTPTFVDDFAHAIGAILKNQNSGIVHVVGSEFISPFDAIQKIGKVFGIPTDYVTQTTRAGFFKNRAPRPSNLSMNNDRIVQLGVQMKSFEEGLFELKKQIA